MSTQTRSTTGDRSEKSVENCTDRCMENAYMKQNGTYTIDGDQLTVTLEAWGEPSSYTFSVDGSSLTMNENSGYGISGTFAKK